jgi:hypothetical protein
MLDVPVYFILGRHELIARSTRAMDSYFTTLRAPAKRMVIFDQLGHAAHHEEVLLAVGTEQVGSRGPTVPSKVGRKPPDWRLRRDEAVCKV